MLEPYSERHCQPGGILYSISYIFYICLKKKKTAFSEVWFNTVAYIHAENFQLTPPFSYSVRVRVVNFSGSTSFLHSLLMAYGFSYQSMCHGMINAQYYPLEQSKVFLLLKPAPEPEEKLGLGQQKGIKSVTVFSLQSIFLVFVQGFTVQVKAIFSSDESQKQICTNRDY